ncbi:big defensin-like [Ruditapes philippinarum]|uniref:big defensin-like n=1 Tax=Ruditapes philippinarum TaxID=129788 RepID=UPI00295BA0AD|nr:big defensin-like [Ruditapes philippinarum]
MERGTLYCIFYIILLTGTTPALCINKVEQEKETNNQKRFGVAAIPVYAGATVSPWVWAALIAAYGAAELYKYSVSKTSSDSHSCANNRGWCRDTCFSHEYIDHYHTPVCGNYYCCRSEI